MLITKEDTDLILIKMNNVHSSVFNEKKDVLLAMYVFSVLQLPLGFHMP